MFAEEEARLLRAAPVTEAERDRMIARRVSGDPLEHILGWVEFCGLRIAVEEGVFVPRQRTAFLVAEAARRIEPGAHVLDLCCGSGAIGLAIADRVGAIDLFASDIDPVAVACARRNLEPIGGRVAVGDLFEAVPSELRGRVDLVVANVPYVPSAAIALMPPEAREHEPRRTLDGGPDGLDLARRVADGAAGWLRPGGRLIIETSEDQVPAATESFRLSGLDADVATDDELGATVVIGRR